MFTTEKRLAILTEKLQNAFEPSYLEVIDEGEKHIGHAGAQSGAGHFCVRIAAKQFENKRKVANHQAIYAVVGDLIPTEIHALRIDIQPLENQEKS